MRRSRAEETIWRKFIRLHVNTLVACDFFSKNVITPLGMRTAYCLAFIHIGTRKVFLSPATYHPHETWVLQQARNVMMWLEDNKLQCRFVLHDRDTKFSFAFDRRLHDAGIQRVRTPLLAPDANAYAESWIGSLKRECLNHFLCFSLGHLDHIGQTYVQFHSTHRPHQGLGNLTIPQAAGGRLKDRRTEMTPHLGRIRSQRFLGGLLRHYYRAA